MASNRAQWLAPGRVTLIGDHTDYSGGFVLPFAIELGTTVEVIVDRDRSALRASRRGTQGTVHRRSGRRSCATARAAGLPTSKEPSTCCGNRASQIDGVTVHCGQRPPSGGRALLISCPGVRRPVRAAGGDRSRDRSACAVARLAQRVENEYIGAPVGFMDPAAVMAAQAGQRAADRLSVRAR